MEIKKKIMLLLLKDFSNRHTVTSLAKAMGMSRVGVWKVIKKLEADSIVLGTPVGKGKTNSLIITLEWGNELLERALSLALAEESLSQKRWQYNFKSMENLVDFLILFGSTLDFPDKSRDIDLIGITGKNNFAKIDENKRRIQIALEKDIHMINFTQKEFVKELQRPNRAFIAAVKGAVLFGHDKYVRFMKRMHKVDR